MEHCLRDLSFSKCVVYLDDVIVPAQDFQEPSKCKFFQTKVRCLGHVVSADGSEPDPDETASLREWLTHPPRTTKGPQTFLGFASSQRSLIESFAKSADPLRRLFGGTSAKNAKTKGKQPFIWTNEYQAALETLISKLTLKPILTYTDFNLPFVLHTDTSSEG